MKTLNLKITISFLFLISILFSCQNKKTDPAPTTVEMGILRLHLHTNLGDNEVDPKYPDSIYTLDNGRKFILNHAQLYISNIQVKKIDGTFLSIPDTIILQTQDDEEYVTGRIPAGQYKSLSFYVGLSPTLNKKTPTNSSSDILNKPNMWFESTAQPGGYVFLNLQGKIKIDSTISAMQDFIYRIGTYANYQQVIMPDMSKPITILPGGTEYFHITTDYNRVFDGVELSDASNLTVNTAADNSKPVATKIRNNIPSMFSYEDL